MCGCMRYGSDGVAAWSAKVQGGDVNTGVSRQLLVSLQLPLGSRCHGQLRQLRLSRAESKLAGTETRRQAGRREARAIQI